MTVHFWNIKKNTMYKINSSEKLQEWVIKIPALKQGVNILKPLGNSVVPWCQERILDSCSLPSTLGPLGTLGFLHWLEIVSLYTLGRRKVEVRKQRKVFRKCLVSEDLDPTDENSSWVRASENPLGAGEAELQFYGNLHLKCAALFQLTSMIQ